MSMLILFARYKTVLVTQTVNQTLCKFLVNKAMSPIGSDYNHLWRLKGHMYIVCAYVIQKFHNSQKHDRCR